MEEVRCTGVRYINECIHATLGNGFYGCIYSGPCVYKRPQWDDGNEIVLQSSYPGCEIDVKAYPKSGIACLHEWEESTDTANRKHWKCRLCGEKMHER